jgi:hypothetical protein
MYIWNHKTFKIQLWINRADTHKSINATLKKTFSLYIWVSEKLSNKLLESFLTHTVGFFSIKRKFCNREEVASIYASVWERTVYLANVPKMIGFKVQIHVLQFPNFITHICMYVDFFLKNCGYFSDRYHKYVICLHVCLRETIKAQK